MKLTAGQMHTESFLFGTISLVVIPLAKPFPVHPAADMSLFLVSLSQPGSLLSNQDAHFTKQKMT